MSDLYAAAKAVDALWDDPDSDSEDAAEGRIWISDEEETIAGALHNLRGALRATPASEAAWLASIERAEQEVPALCKGPNRVGGRSFRMTVPVEETDSDIVLTKGLDAGREAIAALRAIRDTTEGAS